jgi:ATP-dependent DNA helicase RecQ
VGTCPGPETIPSSSSPASGSASTGSGPGSARRSPAAVDGRDVLAVLPTGAGKSAIYELAGLLRGGPTIVVSPLIALQNDQLAHLGAAGLSATVVNSQQSPSARAAALTDPGDFVFLAPEQLDKVETRDALQRARSSDGQDAMAGRLTRDSCTGPRTWRPPVT